MKSVITCDMEGVIETINPDGEKLFGYSKDELIGKKRVSLFSAGEIVIQNVGMWLSQANKKGQYSTRTYFINKNGKKFNAQIYFLLVQVLLQELWTVHHNVRNYWHAYV